MEKDIDIFTEEKKCAYKNETYSVRDNGAVMRHARKGKSKRVNDEEWTFGKLDAKGFMLIGGEKINRIVATAFCGVSPSEQHVVFHKNYNSQDNRAINLSWVTKFEFSIFQPNTQAQLKIITGKSIVEILSDISILQDIDVPNLNWMKMISQAEAEICLQKYRCIEPLFKVAPISDTQEQSDINLQKNNMLTEEAEVELFESLTSNALVEGKMIPSYFPACPSTIGENPLQQYLENLQPKKVYCKNSTYELIVLDAALYDGKIIYKCESGDAANAIKPWSVGTIRYENEKFIHSLYSTCFNKESADKYFNVLQDKEWTGGDVFDDFC